MGDTGCIIQIDNYPGNCSALRGLVPLNVSKCAQIMKLKMCTTSQIFGKICLKSIRDTRAVYNLGLLSHFSFENQTRKVAEILN